MSLVYMVCESGRHRTSSPLTILILNARTFDFFFAKLTLSAQKSEDDLYCHKLALSLTPCVDSCLRSLTKWFANRTRHFYHQHDAGSD